jgi:hypothetical protein
VSDPVDPLSIARLVTRVLESLDVRYSIGGSLASAFAGEPRSTLDVDIVVDLAAPHVAPLASALNGEFYLDRDALRRAVETRSSVNLIHAETSVKIDLFVAGGTPLDQRLLARRRRVNVPDEAHAVYVHSPEDILLQKLRWFRKGGETSDRHWRDVLGIVHVQGAGLDRAYLTDGAATLDVGDLLERALAAAG